MVYFIMTTLQKHRLILISIYITTGSFVLPRFGNAETNSNFGTIKFARITTYSCVMKSWYTNEEIKKADFQNMIFEVQVDKLAPSVISLEKGAIFKNLDPKQKHLITIRKGGKRIESFWLDFKRLGSVNICVWYKIYYQTWQVYNLKNADEPCVRCKITVN